MEEYDISKLYSNLKYIKTNGIDSYGRPSAHYVNYILDKNAEQFILLKNIISEIYTKFNNGEKIYFKFNDRRSDERKGAIGFLSSKSKFTWMNGIDVKDIIYTKMQYHENELVLGFDGMKNTLKVKTFAELTYLKDYKGPSHWIPKAVKNIEEIPVPRDRLHVKIKKGDYAICVISGKINYGIIEHITKGGNIRFSMLVDDKKSLITDTSKIVIVNELKNKMIGAKLHDVC